MILKVIRKQHNAKMCFVCGLGNIAGLQASFFETEDCNLVATFTPTEQHQSYPGRLHGGIASAILDETIGRAVMVGSETEIWGITLNLTMKYCKPVPLNIELRVVARVEEQNSRFFTGSGEILLPDGEIAVSGRGRYMKAPIEKIADSDFVNNEWNVVNQESDPEYIELLRNSQS
jgi:uncharacterized protein (TIGR00369 family)